MGVAFIGGQPPTHPLEAMDKPPHAWAVLLLFYLFIFLFLFSYLVLLFLYIYVLLILLIGLGGPLPVNRKVSARHGKSLLLNINFKLW